MCYFTYKKYINHINIILHLPCIFVQEKNRKLIELDTTSEEIHEHVQQMHKIVILIVYTLKLHGMLTHECRHQTSSV